MYDNLADLYSILIATEHLEKAFIRDAISGMIFSLCHKKRY